VQTIIDRPAPPAADEVDHVDADVPRHLTGRPDRRDAGGDDRGSDPRAGDAPGRFRRVPLVGRVVLVAILVLVVGNGAILGVSALLQSAADAPPQVAGVSKLRHVDDRVWRSAAPTAEGYRNLAAMGVTTVVDLRAEADLEAHDALLAGLDVDLVRLPIRDGQVPTPDVIDEFLQVVRDSDGTVLVHCGAGVGRTSVMAAAYLLDKGAAPMDVVRHNLSVGPPSLEQIAYAASGGDDPGIAVTAMSRALDAPRRIWHNLT
jgi:protein tyrosine phosphatase (PTP) superfamily phosphohydrolase (DUF442 family)